MSKQGRRRPKPISYPALLGTTGRARRRVTERPPPAVAAASLRQEEIEREFQLARDIQQGLLLEAVPQLPGWEISAVSLPARDLGGDLYDFLPLGEGGHGLMIGDVSGKGLPAALRMAVARTVFRHEARRGEPPGPTLAAVNRGVISEIPQGMITMLYAVLDTQSGQLQLANAGHNYPVVIDGCIHELELNGLPLGVDGDSSYREMTTTLRPGDTVLLYTDGVIEALNGANEYYGYERLARLLGSLPNAKPRALMQALLHDLRGWSKTAPADDVTVVVIRRRLESAASELRSILDDVLGVERAAALWAEARPPVSGSASDWAAALPQLIALAQERFGRALARELHGQLRLALEEYR